MALEAYRYSISDFTNEKVDAAVLHEEIANSNITVALDGVSTTVDGYCDVVFKAILGPSDKEVLDGNTDPPGGLIAAHQGDPNPDLSVDTDGVPIFNLKSAQADGTPKFVQGARIGSEAIYATHNFADECTWYSESAREHNEELSSSDGYVWESAYQYWIDMLHGRVFDEEGLIEDQTIFEPEDPHGFNVVVEASDDDGYTWSTLDQREPFAASGGDYFINYEDGYIVTENDYSEYRIRASYSRKNGAGWILRPLDGKTLTIEKAEIQFSIDIDYNTAIVMEVFGNVDIFAPQLSDAYGGPLPSGTPIPLETTKYKTVDQLIDESVGTFPAFPALGGPNRGTTSPMYILQFHYGAAKFIYSSLGMFIRISTENGSSLGGYRSTATFYLISKNDPGISEALEELLS